MKDYKEKCPKCGGWVVGKPNRDFLRDLVHDAPTMGIDNIPVGGNLLGKGVREFSKRVFKTDIDKWGDEVEKMVYNDIQLVFCCANPECEYCWEKNYRLEESEYKKYLLEWVDKTKDLTPKENGKNILKSLWKKNDQ